MYQAIGPTIWSDLAAIVEIPSPTLILKSPPLTIGTSRASDLLIISGALLGTMKFRTGILVSTRARFNAGDATIWSPPPPMANPGDAADLVLWLRSGIGRARLQLIFFYPLKFRSRT